MTNGRTWRIGDLVDMLPPLAEAEIAAPGLNGSQWFVLSVEPRCERRVLADLGKARMPGYVPEQAVMRKAPHRRRYARCLMPLLPGYVFVDLAPTPDAWAAARAVRGVNSFVKGANGINPLCVPDDVVGDIMSAEARGMFADDDRRIVKTGVRVAVIGGPYDGMAGVVTRGGLVTAQLRFDDWSAKRAPITIAVDRLGVLA
ncbi:Transcription antitermination factor NusG [Kaistia soli DSM 19436]|uniref:Transcription antitermination factor NusG n=1 Tax=Kaistia soli DSM 19436 TaxID=1122133 RepID=A0A1M4Y8A3_9HYPH|nr:transcription termination/antitermination NusG family protein [Kaistia soli]SHF01918.1 Transcription antitermination factor NusG [Kaistia soli DSM 19436]